MKREVFTRLMEQSKAINQWAKVEKMNKDQVYEFFFECFCNYRDYFIEKLRYGGNIHRITKLYKPLPEFGILKPSQIGKIVFTSRTMVHWFAFHFWQAIDQQVVENRINKYQIELELTYMGNIPSVEKMEEILYEQREKKCRSKLPLETEAGEIGSKAARVTATVGG